ncbi:radical SAM protein [Blautia coccoides]|uniref:radical SAM/SPASM domain-containing protein n=1 Tax=Blautia producta TaxID=33035 RepID=UPI00214A46F5|nr:radical SAM protein [Blautia coccoides]MCR1985097.1 radical SAM protein [Blautia coccoides]
MRKIHQNNKLCISPNAVFVMHKDKVVAFNNVYGRWIRFSKECFDYLKKAISLKMDETQFVDCFENDNDKDYMKKLLYQLNDIKVLNDPLEKKKISSISILITERCNLYCKHCAANSKKMNEVIDIPTDEMMSILSKVIECNPESITISGGEPLVRKDFKQIISFIRDNSSISIDLMTNATLINDDLAKFLAKNVNVFDISMDGYDEKSCALIRGEGVFDKVINGIKLLQKYGANKIALSMVDIHHSPYEQNMFKKLCKDLGVEAVVRILSASGRAKENLDYLENKTVRKDINPSDNKAVFPPKKEMEDLLKACTCIAGNRCFTIQADGNIVPCDAFSCENIVIGNIRDIKNLSDFIQAEEYMKNVGIGTFLDYSPYGNVICKDCPVRHFCLSCPFQVYDFIKNRGPLEQYCKARKPYFYELIWEEEVE